MQLADFDYELPEHLIAQTPVAERDGSRLLVLKKNGSIAHRRFCDLPGILGSDDVLVVNDSRVFPARLFGKKETGGRVEVLLQEELDGERGIWLARLRSSKPPRLGSLILFSDNLEAELIGDLGRGRYGVKFNCHGDLSRLLHEHGQVPLPPYIKRSPTERDEERYQTVFAKSEGSCAAPTAALHFTSELLERLHKSGVGLLALTLHVGPGTFDPVRTDIIEDHKMEGEWCTISEEVAHALNRAKSEGRRVVAVGTTTTRAVESAFQGGKVMPGRRMARIFITPGYQFRVVDSLLTNFHLPRSTPLVLVSALVGRERVLSAYEEAKRLGYRFYSYGDAFLAL